MATEQSQFVGIVIIWMSKEGPDHFYSDNKDRWSPPHSRQMQVLSNWDSNVNSQIKTTV